MSPSIVETPEAKEMSLLGKVELRIALADSDKKVEEILQTYLAPLLLKLKSQYISVRNKVRCTSRYVLDLPKHKQAHVFIAAFTLDSAHFNQLTIIVI